MALVHTVVLKPRAVIADAFQRFCARPVPLWAVGAVVALPALFASPSSDIPTDLDGLQAYAQNLPSPADMQAQLVGAVKVGILSFLLTAVAWPIIALLTQGVAVEDLFGMATHRIFVAAKAFAAALLAVLVVSIVLMLPTEVDFILVHHHGEPWTTVPGLESMGFWLIALTNVMVTLLLVSLALGALIVVPAEACARPDTARRVLERCWRMTRDYLFPITGLLTWIAGLFIVAGFFTDALEMFGRLGRILSWLVQGALATIPALCGASLHKTLSDNAEATMPAASQVARP